MCVCRGYLVAEKNVGAIIAHTLKDQGADVSARGIGSAQRLCDNKGEACTGLQRTGESTN